MTDNQDILFNELKQGANKDRLEQVKGNQSSKKDGKGGLIGGGFSHYNLSQNILKAIKVKGYNLPTPIQRKAIPAIM